MSVFSGQNSNMPTPPKKNPLQRNVRRLDSGHYQGRFMSSGVTYTSPDTYDFQDEAAAWVLTTKSALRTGTYTPPGLPTTKTPFLEYAMRHIRYQKLALSTEEKNTQLLTNHLAGFHAQEVSSITKAQVDDWYHALEQTGIKTTAAKAYTLLAAIMRRAVDDDLLTKNPCRIKGARAGSTQKPQHIPSSAEVQILINNLNGQNRLMVFLDSQIGLRYGELTSLQRKDFVWSNAFATPRWQVNIERSVTLVNGTFVQGPPKSKASKRTMTVPPELNSAIESHLNQNVGPDPDSLFFPSASGTYIRNDVFRRNWDRALVRGGLNLKNFTPHCLRHFAATNFVNDAGANIAELQAFLGDSSVEAAMRYLNPNSRLNTLVERMNTHGLHLPA
jgi:integrase